MCNMRLFVHIVLLVMLTMIHQSAASTAIEPFAKEPMKSAAFQLVARGWTNLWTWLQNKGQNEDSFVGRCFGVARKLKFIMPLIIFKLGVIITTLAFLTIFSLKSLGLLVLLLLINSSGLAAKFAFLKHGGDHNKELGQPQNVHFHIHQNKDGQYSVGHSSPSYDHGWYDRSSILGSAEESLTERLKKLNVYDSYRR